MFVRVEDIDVHLQQSGPADGPALLLLHSLGTQGAIWDDQAEALAGRYRVIRPDFRGHGLTGVTPGPYAVEALARDILALMDRLPVPQAYVAGVSLGGLVAQSLAIQAPDRVLGLILVDTALALPPAQTWRDRASLVRSQGIEPLVEPVVARWVTAGSLATPAANGLRAMLRRTDPEGYAAAAEAVGAADFTEAARTIRAPTLVLVGDGDVATPPSSADALSRAIPGSRLEILADAAHIPTVERPEAVTAAMERFLGAPGCI